MADDQPTILLAGGGTGGHLYPGIAVADALRREIPGVKLIFLCTTKEIDRIILEPTGFEFIPQPVLPLPRLTSVGGLLRFWRGWRETKDLVRKLLRERKPMAVLGLGGYAAGVAVKVAGLRGIPTAILNPDLVPGRANQYLMQYAKAVCAQFADTVQRVPAVHREKVHITGCPIRDDIRKLAEMRDIDITAQRAPAIAKLGLEQYLHIYTPYWSPARRSAQGRLMKRSLRCSRDYRCKAGRFCTFRVATMPTPFGPVTEIFHCLPA
jgi:UDP-N-acetylglucosamine:LPS N-acetylglucosamine transferase